MLIWGLNPTYVGAKELYSGLSVTDFDVLEDKNAEYDIQTVSGPKFSAQFHHYNQDAISMGISQSVYWVRFILPDVVHDNDEIKRFVEFSNSSFSKIDVYIPMRCNDDVPQYSVKQVGTFRPLNNCDVLDNNWVIAVPPGYSKGQFVYLRLETVSVFRLPVVVWTEKDLLAHDFYKNLSYGIFYGIIIAMLIYNLLVFYTLKDKAYFFYVLYVAATFMYQLEDYGYLRLLVELSYPLYRGLFWFWLSMAFASSILFTGCFLRVHRGESIWFRLLASLIIIAFLEGVTGMAGYEILANRIAHGLGVALPVAFMTLAFIRFRQGYQPARFYLLAWGALSAGVLLWTLLPYKFFGVNELMVSTVAEMILLSLALSDRFRQMRIRELTLTRHIDYYKDLSDIDELTGLYNRRSLNRRIRQEFQTAILYKGKLSIMVMDIDFFKHYNDSYGHWQGDQVLVRLGRLLLRALESSKLAFRYGGEEFVVLVPDISSDKAMIIAERIRLEFAKEEFMPLNNHKVSVTLSIGITDLMAGDTLESLFERADKALYYAKERGRNRIVKL